MNNNSQFKLNARLWLFLSSVVIATFASCPHLSAIVWVWAFPAGLGIVFSRDPTRSLDLIDAVIGWAVYFGLAHLGLRTKRRWLFFIAFLLFCSLLVFNAIGCRRFWNSSLGDLH